MQSTVQKLRASRVAKNDEFYTQYADVKKECDNYLSHFFNKIIYCNCDTAQSAFVKYFKELKSAGLIKDIWFSGGIGGDDFRSAKSVEKLKMADIVVTNPPFSLFRAFMDLLIRYDKKFLIIGNKNAIANKGLFHEIKAGRVHLGTRRFKDVMWFILPSGARQSVPATWYTNMRHEYMRPFMLFRCKYSAEDYPRYDNADAINVDKVVDIPSDYEGVMGVPITFIDNYNPGQFIILGMGRFFTPTKTGVLLQGRQIYHRIFIQRKK